MIRSNLERCIPLDNNISATFGIVARDNMIDGPIPPRSDTCHCDRLLSLPDLLIQPDRARFGEGGKRPVVEPENAEQSSVYG
jgi:hypothetical protein